MTEKELRDIVDALNSGVVPRSGIENIMVGREDVIAQVTKDLEKIKDGSSLTKFIVGKFGTGKSFVQALIAQKAHSQNFVVSSVDFSPQRKLYNNDGLAKATYTEILKNMTTSVSSKNTVETIIETWMGQQISLFSEKEGFSFENDEFVNKIDKHIKKEIKDIDTCFGGSDFSTVLVSYFRAYILGDSDKQRGCIKWICGEYANISSAKRDLNVSVIIDDQNYYEFLKVFCKFVVLAGYSGLVINFDEAINLYNISQKNIRDKNYEMILRIYNDTIQGSVQHLYITFGGTPQLLEDQFKGLYSYGALKSRLQSNKYESDEFADYSQPVITLRYLTNEETVVLLKRIKKIHELFYKYESSIVDEDIVAFIKSNYKSLEGNKITVRSIVRDFFGFLNILQRNPNAKKEDLLSVPVEKKPANEVEDVLKRFEAL